VRVLHVLSQRPSLTGSGVTLDAVVRCAATAGHGLTSRPGKPPTRVQQLRDGGQQLEHRAAT
jgi:hypothetical protein